MLLIFLPGVDHFTDPAKGDQAAFPMLSTYSDLLLMPFSPVPLSYAETVCIQLCQQVDAADPQGIFRKCQASPGKCFPDQLLGTQILSDP